MGDTTARRAIEQSADGADAGRTDFSAYTSYEEDGRTVVCDRKNPSAWIGSDEAVVPEP